ncbi:MAG: hypothetical protein WC205_11820 [Opitutaceae bacterium]|jgi:hypothetical protein
MNILLSLFGPRNADRSDPTQIVPSSSERNTSSPFQLRSTGVNESKRTNQPARPDRGGDCDTPSGDWRKA